MKLQLFDDMAGRQHGLITRAQVLEVASEHQLRRSIRSGDLQRVRRNVYRLPGAPVTYRQGLMALTLTDGAYVASHRSAAQLHELGNHWNGNFLEVSTHQAGRHSLVDVLVHKAPLMQHHCSVVDGIHVTTAARTIVDLAAVAHPAAIARALDHVLSKRLLRLDHIDAVLADVSRPGRPKLGRLATLLQERRTNLTHSPLERRTLQWIRNAGLPDLIAQYPVDTERCTYHFDLAYPTVQIGIESDGFDAHANRSAFDDDARRNSALAAQGWRIIHVTSSTPEADFARDLRNALRFSHIQRGA